MLVNAKALSIQHVVRFSSTSCEETCSPRRRAGVVAANERRRVHRDRGDCDREGCESEEDAVGVHDEGRVRSKGLLKMDREGGCVEERESESEVGDSCRRPAARTTGWGCTPPAISRQSRQRDIKWVMISCRSMCNSAWELARVAEIVTSAPPSPIRSALSHVREPTGRSVNYVCDCIIRFPVESLNPWNRRGPACLASSTWRHHYASPRAACRSTIAQRIDPT